MKGHLVPTFDLGPKIITLGQESRPRFWAGLEEARRKPAGRPSPV